MDQTPQEQDWIALVEKADRLATRFAYEEAGNEEMQFPCGFAWINVRDARSAFAKFLVRRFSGVRSIGGGMAGQASADSYAGGVTIWVGGFNQSMNHKEAYARVFARVLQEAGIKAYAHSRMD